MPALAGAPRSSSHATTKRSTTPPVNNHARASSTRARRSQRPSQPVLPTAGRGSTLALIAWADHTSIPPPSTVGAVGVKIDTSGNGVADSLGYDTTGDGIIDALDTNDDGMIDTVIIVRPSTQTRRAGGSGSQGSSSTSGTHTSSATASGRPDGEDDADSARVAEMACQVFQIIDADADGHISKLELLASMLRNQTVDDFVLPGTDCSRALTDERSFDAVSAVFEAIGAGKTRIDRETFVDYFRRLKGGKRDDSQNEVQMRSIFDLIDADGRGTFSNFDLLGALQRFSAVASFLLPGIDRQRILRDEACFDAASVVWDEMARGKRRVGFVDFVAYVDRAEASGVKPGQPRRSSTQPLQQSRLKSMKPSRSLKKRAAAQEDSDGDKDDKENDGAALAHTTARHPQPKNDIDPKPTLLQSLRQKADSNKKPVKPHHDKPRHEKCVLIIGPGFGRLLNPEQAALVQRAGFKAWYVDVPNPEDPNFVMSVHLPHVQDAIDELQPDVLVSASKGNPYVFALWEKKLWKGPTLMINASPSLTKLPKDATVVLCHGSNDELWPRSRADLEALIATGSENRCFLYYTANSGQFSGGFTRLGDKHNMASLLQYDCLPRLIDAASCDSGPELHMITSWRQRLSKQRDRAEQWLSHCPEQLRNLWVSSNHMGMDARKLYEVPRSSEEFEHVATIFKAKPAEPPAYLGTDDAAWEKTLVLRVERVENGLQEQSENAYYESMRRSIEDQGLTLEPGVHTRWAFHGTDQIESIIEDPMTGFQPLACGTRLGSLWGSGTYFARDARYVFDGNFCPVARDGTRQMLLCLLMTGMPCLGDPQQHGVLPFRRKPYRHHSSVDSLSSPEIFITQHPGAAYPAYLITFA